MRCPFCGHLESQVKDSRPSDDGAAIRRRRLCPECGGRFTTFERVQLRELTILKRSGRRTPFDREKLVRSISIATRKRPVDPERVERMVSAIVRQLESMGETELASHVVGEMVMKALKALDDVAYVRYASVYRDFRQTEDFAKFLSDEGLADEPEESKAAIAAPGRESRLSRPVRQARSVARLAAVQALYQMEVSGVGADAVVAGICRSPLRPRRGRRPPRGGRRGVLRLLVARRRRRAGRDRSGHHAAPRRGWRLERIDATVRAILRAGAFELMRLADIPARSPSTNMSRSPNPSSMGAEAGFVNATLDRIARDERSA